MKRLLKRKLAFEGQLIKLYSEKQRFPGGCVVDLDVVRHPGAVLIVPFLAKNKIVLIKQYRPVINSYIWELPAGTLAKNERPLRCAKRELAEETGYQARRWKRLGFIFPAPGYTTERIVIFLAGGLKAVPSQKEEDEVIFSKVFSKRVVRKLFDSGRFVDAKTICALKMAQVL